MVEAEPSPATLAERAAVLFRAYRDGDAARIGDLVELLTPILWHTARGQRLDRQTAEDVVQTVWLALVRSSAAVSDPQAVLQWLLVTTRREAWRAGKRLARDEPHDLDSSGVDTFVAPDDTQPEQVVLRSDREATLWRHIARLPERCRALLRVVAFADRPDYASVAKALGMPVGSIGPTRGRCLAKLRLSLAAEAAETREGRS